jgi:hypothetical protein
MRWTFEGPLKIAKVRNPPRLGENARGVCSYESGKPYQTRPGSRVVTSWTSQVLPSGSLKEKNDP